MTANNSTMSVEDVLEQFMLEEEHGSDTLERYVRAHPQFAVQLIDLSRMIGAPDVDDDRALSATDRSRIDSAWIAHAAARPEASGNEDPFATLTGTRGKTMSNRLGVPRQVITCFRERKIVPSSVPVPIVRHFADEFELPMAHVIAAMQLPARASAGRSYKADGKPGTDGQISFEQVLIDAGVSEADRARLLAAA